MGKQLKFWFLAVLTTLMVLAGSILQVGEPLMAAPSGHANYQVIAIANQLYTQYPDIPRAERTQAEQTPVNQTNTTFLSRFIHYHLDAKARPAQYHLDWELSMADYLDAPYSDHIEQTAMLKTDKMAMHTLTRQQRHDLVRTLEQLFAQ